MLIRCKINRGACATGKHRISGTGRSPRKLTLLKKRSGAAQTIMAIVALIASVVPVRNRCCTIPHKGDTATL